MYSRAISSADGFLAIAYGQVSFKIGSGNAPPSFAYRVRIRKKSSPRISRSVIASPGGSAPFQCHCRVRPEFVSEPSSSAKQPDGSRKTSVSIFSD